MLVLIFANCSSFRAPKSGNRSQKQSVLPRGSMQIHEMYC